MSENVLIDKYMKYKNKINNLIGGAFPFKFGHGGGFYILAKLGGDTLERVNERRSNLGLPPLDILHITLWNMHVNFAHPKSKIFYEQNFKEAIVNSYNKNIRDNAIYLESQKKVNGQIKGGVWGFFGRGPIEDKYWVREYKLPDVFIGNVRQFRIDIYKSIEKILQRNIERNERQERGKFPDKDYYDVYSVDSQELYAIHSDTYSGVTNWKPHISLFKIKDLDPTDVQNIISMQSDDDKSAYLKSRIGKSVKPISNISFGGVNKNISQLVLSLRAPNSALNYEDRINV